MSFVQLCAEIHVFGEQAKNGIEFIKFTKSNISCRQVKK